MRYELLDENGNVIMTTDSFSELCDYCDDNCQNGDMYYYDNDLMSTFDL